MIALQKYWPTVRFLAAICSRYADKQINLVPPPGAFYLRFYPEHYIVRLVDFLSSRLGYTTSFCLSSRRGQEVSELLGSSKGREDSPLQQVHGLETSHTAPVSSVKLGKGVCVACRLRAAVWPFSILEVPQNFSPLKPFLVIKCSRMTLLREIQEGFYWYHCWLLFAVHFPF